MRALEPFLLTVEQRREIVATGGTAALEKDDANAFNRDRAIVLEIPVTPPGRGTTADGRTSFHFKVTSISRKAVPLRSGRPLILGRGDAKDASDFEEYVGRPGSAQIVTSQADQDEHGAYVERPGAGQDSAAANGRPRAFSNISEHRIPRLHYWSSVQAHERQPRTHQLVFHPHRSPRFWASVDRRADIVEPLRSHLLRVRAAYQEYKGSESPSTKSVKAEPMRVTAEEAGALLGPLMWEPSISGSAPPVEFKSGRGGRYQFRIEAELPHELSPQDRDEITRQFCEFLGSLGLMYTGVTHRPDDHGDRRNSHMHLIFHDRPAKLIKVSVPEAERIEGESATRLEWDFAYAVRMVDRKGRKSVTYPHRQPKVALVSQSYAVTGSRDSGPRFAVYLRRVLAGIVNRMLALRGRRRRYDPRRYSEMGIDLTPLRHLGKRMAGLERDGFDTSDGSWNAVVRYADLERRIHRWRFALQRENLKWRAQISDRMRTRADDPNQGNHEKLALLIEDRFRLRKEEITVDWELALFWLRLKQARSRALLVRAARAGEQQGRGAERARLALRRAETHLMKIDAAVEPYLDVLEDIERASTDHSRLADLFDAEIRLCFDDPLRMPELERRKIPLAVSPSDGEPSPEPSSPAGPAPSSPPAAADSKTKPPNRAPGVVTSKPASKPGAQPPVTQGAKPAETKPPPSPPSRVTPAANPVESPPPTSAASRAALHVSVPGKSSFLFDYILTKVSAFHVKVEYGEGRYHLAQSINIEQDLLNDAVLRAGDDYVQKRLRSLYLEQNPDREAPTAETAASRSQGRDSAASPKAPPPAASSLGAEGGTTAAPSSATTGGSTSAPACKPDKERATVSNPLSNLPSEPPAISPKAAAAARSGESVARPPSASDEGSSTVSDAATAEADRKATAEAKAAADARAAELNRARETPAAAQRQAAADADATAGRDAKTAKPEAAEAEQEGEAGGVEPEVAEAAADVKVPEPERKVGAADAVEIEEVMGATGARPEANADQKASGASDGTDVTAALAYLGKNGQLWKWNSDAQRWIVDMDALPERYHAVVKAPEYDGQVQAALEKMNQDYLTESQYGIDRER
jgi:hypothetical protein